MNNTILSVSLLVSLAVAQHLITPGIVLAQSSGPAPVAVSKVLRDEVDAVQRYVGTVYPSRGSEVGSAVDGRVAEFPVSEGDFIRQGEPLAQLLTETISLEVEAAKAELQLKKHELTELENGARPEELAAAEAKKLAAKARSEYRQAQLERAQRLFEKGAVNEDELHEIESEAEAASQSYRESAENWKLLVAGPREEQILQAKAQVAKQDAVVRNLESRLRKHTIKAPYDGFVVREHTEVGQWVQRGELVAEVAALDEVDILVHVLEAHIPHVRQGAEMSVEIPALGGAPLNGIVDEIVPQADLKARTFPVRIRMQNRMKSDVPWIKAGMLARAVLPTGEKKKALLVPKDALVLGGENPTVFVVDTAGSADKSEGEGKAEERSGDEGEAPAGKVRPVSVVTGNATGRLISVTGALKEGDLVVVRGNERLRPGQEVVINETLAPGAEPRAQATP